MEDTRKTPAEEQQTPQLRIVCADVGIENDAEVILDFEQHTEQKETEAFWAGRNLAQRRSARTAA